VRIIRALAAARHLAASLARREIEARYKANALGLLWLVATPLLLLGAYTFVFAIIFPARWPAPTVTGAAATATSAGEPATQEAGQGLGLFALNVFLGLLFFAVFREVVARAPGLVVANRHYVKRVVFPLEALSLADLFVALFSFGVGIAVWLVGFVAITRGLPHVEALLIPVLLLPVALTALGVSWFLSALGVFLRDIAHAVELAITVLMFLTPVFYPLDRVPERFRVVLEWNPLAHAIEGARAASIQGIAPDWPSVAAALGASLIIALMGFATFSKARRAFADVL
jgi:lipopolysaccharide transport system permease protein